MPAKVIQTDVTPFKKVDLDPITLDIIESALKNARYEMDAVLYRTAMSPGIREQHDEFPMIANPDGDMVVGQFGSFMHGFKREYDGTIEEGDLFLTSDPYSCAGAISHANDWLVLRPMYYEGRLIGYASMFGHMSDVGGKTPGSLPTDANQIYEEGVVIPVVKIYKNEELQEDVLNVILHQCRMPHWNRSDFNALIAGVRLAEKRVVELCDRFGVDKVEGAFYEIIDRCAEVVKEKGLPFFPEGEFIGEDFIENDGLTLDEPIKLQLTMRKYEEKMILDFEGTSPQAKGPINWPLDGRHYSKWLGAFFKAQIPGIIINEGVTDVFRCRIPKRTILSSEFPAPVVSRMTCMLRMISAYTVALAKAFDGEVVADMQCIQIYGMYGQDLDGNLFLMREIFGAGSGARPQGDGTDAVDLVPYSKNLPAEFIEQRFPVKVEKVGLAMDSGGPGKYRGGLGYVKEIRPLVDGHYTTVTERTAFASIGIKGGLSGQPGGSIKNPETETEEHVFFSRDAVPVKANDLIRLVTPGGGGWGDPLERDIEAVRLDVVRKLVSFKSAERDYGVIIDQETFEVDQTATDSLRKTTAIKRGPVKLINRGPYAQTLIRNGVLNVSDPEMENMELADDKVLEHYWKDLYKYTAKPST